MLEYKWQRAEMHIVATSLEAMCLLLTWGNPYITSHEFHDFLIPPPPLVTGGHISETPPSVTSHILQFSI